MADLVRPTWIALASGAPLVDVASGADGSHLHVETDRERFGVLLTTSRPRVAIVATPPATDADEALVLRERRRRSSLRIVRHRDVGLRSSLGRSVAVVGRHGCRPLTEP